MKEIALITNYNIYEKSDAAMKVAQKLSEHDCRLLVPIIYKEKIMRMNRFGAQFTYLPTSEIYKTADTVVVLGGDGSILDAARNSAERGIPVLGINLGRLGYMAELEMNELDLLPRIINNDFTVDRRSMLNVELINANGRVKETAYALNDAVISNGSVARIVDLELYENGELLNQYRADGLIVATPTGSTAYSLSAGGAVVDPRLGCFCVTPICPHSLVARPVIFPDSAVLEIKNTCQREKMLFLTLDGRTNFELYRNEKVRITRSELCANLIRLKNSGFYSVLRSKMS